MGIFAPPQSQPHTTGPTFGRGRFEGAHVVKWNCVYRVQNAHEIRNGDYTYQMFVAFGTLAQVEALLRDWSQPHQWD
jgi:hypothetical protein